MEEAKDLLHLTRNPFPASFEDIDNRKEDTYSSQKHKKHKKQKKKRFSASATKTPKTQQKSSKSKTKRVSPTDEKDVQVRPESDKYRVLKLRQQKQEQRLETQLLGPDSPAKPRKYSPNSTLYCPSGENSHQFSRNMANTGDTDQSPRRESRPATQKAKVAILENENKRLKKDLDKCRKDKLKADDAVAKAATEISVLRKNVGDLKNINAKLEKKIKTSKKIGKKFFSRKGKVDYKNDPMAKTIKDIVKSKIWRTVKFVDSDAELEKITRMALQYIDFEDQDDEDDDYLDKYVDRYMAAVCEALNEKKSYCQSEMKKVIFEYYDQKQKTIPTIEDIMKCSLRQIDSDHLKKLFCFYTDKLMPTVVGSEAWGKNIRHYTLLSEATIDDDGESKQLITASTEAFLVVLYENCHNKWIKWLEKLEKKPNTSLTEKTMNSRLCIRTKMVAKRTSMDGKKLA